MNTSVNSKKTKYIDIAEQLMEEIFSGKYRAGEKFYSRSELTAKFHISPVTAIRVQNYLAYRGYVRKVHGGGTFINYDKDSFEMKLEQKSYPKIKRIVELRLQQARKGGFHADFYAAIDDLVRQAGIAYELKTYGLSEISTNAINMLPTDSETGYLVLSSGAQSIIYSISALINPTLHNVLVDNYIPGSNCVLTDSFDGMGKIVDYAVEAGCQRFIFAKSFVESLGNLYNEERAYAGVYHCSRHGYKCNVIDSSYEELLQAIASKKQVKTCVMFSQDEGAYRLKKLLKGHKRNVLVTGFDDYKGFEKSTMPLTTIRVNKFEMIKAAIGILTRPHVWRKKIIRIPGDLIIRE